MENNGLNDLQNKLLELFAVFHEYCERYHLRYFCLGGTMLGAARHEGFIPWDDDIDVGMPRKDYETLLDLIGGQEFSHYYLESYKNGAADFSYTYAKFYDTNTTLIENNRYKIKRGVFIDIFPLDGMGHDEYDARINYARIVKLLDLLAIKVSGIRKGRKFYKNLCVLLGRLIPDFILSPRKLIEKINNMSRILDYDDAEFICNVDGAWREKELMDKRIFGTPKLYDFNGLKVFGVCDADAYLTHLYGDWRQLPPVEKQQTHHDFIMLDLMKSYKMI